jgi:hypothetical protein
MVILFFCVLNLILLPHASGSKNAETVFYQNAKQINRKLADFTVSAGLGELTYKELYEWKRLKELLQLDLSTIDIQEKNSGEECTKI